MLADPKARALTENFAGQWLYLRNLRGIQPNSDLFPDFDDNLRAGDAHRGRAVLRERRRRRPQRGRPADGRRHLRQRAAGAALRRGRRDRGALPPRPRAPTRAAGCSARARSCWPPRTPPPRRRCCAASGCSTTSSARRRRRRRPTCRRWPRTTRSAPRTMREQLERHRASPTCAALPQADGPDRLRARELRRRRRLARRQRIRRPARHRRRAGRRHRRSTAWTGCARRWPRARTSSCARSSRSCMTYALGRGLTRGRHARGARDRARRAAGRLPVLGDCPGDRRAACRSGCGPRRGPMRRSKRGPVSDAGPHGRS